jgi:hypothetical protein
MTNPAERRLGRGRFGLDAGAAEFIASNQALNFNNGGDSI